MCEENVNTRTVYYGTKQEKMSWVLSSKDLDLGENLGYNSSETATLGQWSIVFLGQIPLIMYLTGWWRDITLIVFLL